MTVVRSIFAALAPVLLAVPAYAQDLEFALMNNSGYTLVVFYTSPANVSSWEEDVLGYGVLESGDTLTISVADGRTQCVYDMLMVFDDGDRLEDRVDMCRLGS